MGDIVQKRVSSRNPQREWKLGKSVFPASDRLGQNQMSFGSFLALGELILSLDRMDIEALRASFKPLGDFGVLGGDPLLEEDRLSDDEEELAEMESLRASWEAMTWPKSDSSSVAETLVKWCSKYSCRMGRDVKLYGSS